MENKEILDGIARARALAEQGLLLASGRAMINNNNNNNDSIITIKTFNDDAHESDNQKLLDSVTPWQASPSQDSSSGQEAERGSVSAETPPWKYIKADLYDNATDVEQNKNIRKLKLKLNYLIAGQTTYKRVTASLGGRFRDIKKGMDLTGCIEDIEHHGVISEVYEFFKNEYTNVSASKCYSSTGKGKGHSVFGLSVVVGEMPKEGNYIVAVIYNNQCQLLQLENLHLTQTQRSKNQIASGYWGTSKTKRITLDEFNQGE